MYRQIPLNGWIHVTNPEVLKSILSQLKISAVSIANNHIFITLTDYSIDSYFTDNIAFKITIPQIYLNIETANPCGLIINELISNAVEHAFVGRERGKIALDFQENSHREFSLIIKDDGIGFPEYKDFFNSESLGLELVVTLVEQLEGQIEMNNSNGTEIKITFKELNYKNRI